MVIAALLFAPAVSCAAEPAAQPAITAGWIGANYTPAYAANQVQFWHEFKPEVIEKELAAARRHFAINTLRVYLHYINYRDDRENFLANIEKFIVLCDRAGIKPGFVFFDDCWNRAGISLKTEPAVPGRHNGRWAAVQDVDRKDENLPLFESYVSNVVSRYRTDGRVLWWEVYNEPKREDRFTELLCQKGYAWVKARKPVQPVLCCWDDNPQTEIVDAHNYTVDWAAWDRQADMNPAKGTVFTEAGARWMAPRNSSGSPTEVIHWLRTRKAAGKYVPGVYLCWELMVGNSNCRWYWGTPDGAHEPTIPWCGLLMPDCTPVSYAEAEAIRSYATGKNTALFYDDFQDEQASAPRAGWTRYGEAGGAAGYLAVPANTKFIAGNNAWSNYVMEAAVMLKGTTGNAGLVMRVNEPGSGPDDMKGYYIGFSTDKLYLGKMNNNWQELATCTLTNIACKVEPDVWNRLRVSIKGNQIRVWFNPVHSDPGLRIEYTDDKEPVLKGNIGVRAAGVQAWVEDVVVLPAENL